MFPPLQYLALLQLADLPTRERVSSPSTCLSGMVGEQGLVERGGLLVVATSSDWSEDVAPPQEWLGGNVDADGNELSLTTALEACFKVALFPPSPLLPHRLCSRGRDSGSLELSLLTSLPLLASPWVAHLLAGRDGASTQGGHADADQGECALLQVASDECVSLAPQVGEWREERRGGGEFARTSLSSDPMIRTASDGHGPIRAGFQVTVTVHGPGPDGLPGSGSA
eukprot:767132-Hanusia_phi.AAC.1